MNCDQCEALRINGRFCHEHGCPNAGKHWDGHQWIRRHECRECGYWVDEGEACDCLDYGREQAEEDFDATEEWR